MRREQPVEHIEREKRPEIVYCFFFNLHGTEKDFERFDEVFEDADIYVPESFGRTQYDLDKLNAISQGNLDPKQAGAPRNSYIWKVTTLLYKSEKPVLFADALEGDELLGLYEEIKTHDIEAVDLFVSGKFDEAIEKYKKHSQKFY